MTEETSANPEDVAVDDTATDDAAITPAFEETAAGRRIDPNEIGLIEEPLKPPTSPPEQFNAVADEDDERPTELANKHEKRQGYYKKEGPDDAIVWVDLARDDAWDSLLGLIEYITLPLRPGGWETFVMLEHEKSLKDQFKDPNEMTDEELEELKLEAEERLGILFPEEVYPDEEDRTERVRSLASYTMDPNDPRRGQQARDVVRNIFGDQNIDNLKPHIGTLFSTIIQYESGDDPNVVNDYMGSAGLRDGDTTRGGLYVGIMLDADGNQIFEASRRNEAVTIRAFDESPIYQVRAWQDAYKDEIRAYYEANNIVDEAGNRKLPSSALGIGQFTDNRLGQLISQGRIDENAIFSLSYQRYAIVQSMASLIDHAVENSDGTTEGIKGVLRANFRREWQALQRPDLQNILNTTIDQIARDADRTNLYSPDTPMS